MNLIAAWGAHHSMKKVAVSAAFIGIAAAGLAVPAGAAPSAVGTPGTPVPLQEPAPAPGVPTDPSAVDCAATPTDPACTAGADTVLTPEFVPPSVPVWPTEPPETP